MGSIGRIVPSAFTAFTELAPALANVNFDFTLLKVEAPAEFKEIGKALSGTRRAEAESGRAHITARQLGALFSSILPKTPQLFSAYGHRASEVLKSADTNPIGHAADGFFATYVGADATTIWAGATSGGPAVAAHLLSCLLASIWDPPEAISIWVEIVQARKKEIVAGFEDNNIAHSKDMFAAQQDISRAALADWDASARAWIRCADLVMRRQQKQVRLIFQDRSAAVENLGSTYASVVGAWTSSLRIFESLASGTSQRVDSGDVALALSAWHLYPDMLLIIDPEPVTVTQNDILFSGPVLTIGLEVADETSSGIMWSLPLANLRHYGQPVQCKNNVNSMDRLTLEELRFVLLGAFTANHDFVDLKFDKIINWVHHVHETLRREESRGSIKAAEVMGICSRGSWLGILFDAARAYLDATGSDLQEACRMVKLGRRQSSVFLGQGSHNLFSSFHGSFGRDASNEEDCISLLRNAAAKLPGDPRHYFIRYRHDYSQSGKFVYEYATAKAQKQHRKRDNSGEICDDHLHTRWLYFGSRNLDRTDDDRYYKKLKAFYDNYNTSLPEIAKYLSYWVPRDFHRWHAERGHKNQGTRSDRQEFSNFQNDEARTQAESRAAMLSNKGERVSRREDYTIEDFEPLQMGIFWPSTTHPHPWYECVFGNEEAGIFFSSHPVTTEDQALWRTGNLSHVVKHVKQTASKVSPTIFLDTSTKFAMSDSNLTSAIHHWLGNAQQSNKSGYFSSMKAMATGISLLRNSRCASVDVRVLELGQLSSLNCFEPFEKRLYHEPEYTMSQREPQITIPQVSLLLPVALSVQEAFACLCFFETGRFDLEPEILEDHEVVAMCCGNSIYIADRLLTDPSHWITEKSKSPVKRIVGNIGRSGIAFLVPPEEPMICPASIEEFREILHKEFDGCLQDNFKSTTLHLSFTTAERVIDMGSVGARDAELYFLETRLSLHEGRSWVADLDVLAAKVEHKICSHQEDAEDDGELYTSLEDSSITCMDNWTEVRSPTETDLNVVRAEANWQARMAAAALCSALGYRVTVLPKKGCRHCIADHKQPDKGVAMAMIA